MDVTTYFNHTTQTQLWIYKNCENGFYLVNIINYFFRLNSYSDYPIKYLK